MTVQTSTPISMSDIKSGTGLTSNDLGSYYRSTTNAGWTPASGAISFNDLRGAWAKSTVYLTGDVITNPSGKTYVAKNSGTSSSIDNSYPTHTFGTVIDGTNGIYWEYNTAPYYNRGINKPPAQTAINAETIATQRANEAKLAIGLEAGKAYVRGYEFQTIAPTKAPKIT